MIGLCTQYSFPFRLKTGLSSAILALSLFLLRGGVCSQIPPATQMICPGEDLLYEVSWMGIGLGRIRVVTWPSVQSGGVLIHRASAHINSYDGLPFVNVHAVDSTEMDLQFFSEAYLNFEQQDDGWSSERLLVDSVHRFVVVEKSLVPSIGAPPLRPPELDTVKLDGSPIQNGLSILFFAREGARRGTGTARQQEVTTVIYGKKGRTRFFFGNTPEYTEIDAWKDRKIRVVRFTGKAEFKGLFGLTGDFTGWCTDDAASVPVRAELRVLLGSVRVELIRWKRAGWTPPG